MRVPYDPVGAVFTPDIRARLIKRLIHARSRRTKLFESVEEADQRRRSGRTKQSQEEIELRQRFAEACAEYGTLEEQILVPIAEGLGPSDLESHSAHKRFRMLRAAWDAYFSASFLLGMFEGEAGNDLLSRLRSKDHRQHWQAMAECIVAWFLAGKMNAGVSPRAKTDKGKVPEFRVELGGDHFFVEVKAPFRVLPLSVGLSHSGAEALRGSLEKANKQLPDDKGNVLFLLPKVGQHGTDITCRNDLVRLLFGRSVIQATYNRRTGEMRDLGVVLKSDGGFLNLVKGGTEPGFTRISLVIMLKRSPVYRSEPGMSYMEHSLYVVQNPNARHPLSLEPWREWPIYSIECDSALWSDSHEVIV